MDKDRLNLIPHQPGSYQYYNKDGIIIYVGFSMLFKIESFSYLLSSIKGFKKNAK